VVGFSVDTYLPTYQGMSIREDTGSWGGGTEGAGEGVRVPYYKEGTYWIRVGNS
jgi:hypothetical protein